MKITPPSRVPFLAYLLCCRHVAHGLLSYCPHSLSTFSQHCSTCPPISALLYRCTQRSSVRPIIDQVERRKNSKRRLASWKPEIEILSEEPHVFLVRNFLSPQECESYIDRVMNFADSSNGREMTTSNPPKVSLDASKLWPLPILSIMAGVPSILKTLHGSKTSGNEIDVLGVATAVLPAVGLASIVSIALVISVVNILQQFAAPASRTSQAVALNQVDDLRFIRELVARSCNVTDLPWQCFEAPVVTRYESGAAFGLHNDASPTRGNEWDGLGGQRVATVIVYLNSCENGGATKFDRLGFQVQPRQGSALVFFPSCRKTLNADDRTRHESLPAVDEKWIVQCFGRIGPRVPPPLGIPNVFNDLIL